MSKTAITNTVLILAGLAAIGAALYFMGFFKKESLDDQYFKKMQALLLQYTDLSDAMTEVALILQNNGQGTNWAISKENYVNGKLTKTGVLFQVYAANIYPWLVDSNLEKQMWALWNEFRMQSV